MLLSEVYFQNFGISRSKVQLFF